MPCSRNTLEELGYRICRKSGYRKKFGMMPPCRHGRDTGPQRSESRLPRQPSRAGPPDRPSRRHACGLSAGKDYCVDLSSNTKLCRQSETHWSLSARESLLRLLGRRDGQQGRRAVAASLGAVVQVDAGDRRTGPRVGPGKLVQRRPARPTSRRGKATPRPATAPFRPAGSLLIQ